jgi:hypothetical protein
MREILENKTIAQLVKIFKDFIEDWESIVTFKKACQ